MGLVQGNVTVVDSTVPTGFIPEITPEGMFSLNAVMCTPTSTTHILIHQEQLNISAEHSDLLAGHARDMLLRYMLGNGALRVHVLAEQLRHIADCLRGDSIDKLRRKVLTHEEGHFFSVKCSIGRGRVTAVPQALRFEVMDVWDEIIARHDVHAAALYSNDGTKLAEFNSRPISK